MININLIRIINFSFILFFSLFFLNDAFAKSTDKKKFLKLYKEAENIIAQNNGISEITYNLIGELDKKFNISKMNIDSDVKSEFYFYRCDGSAKFEKSARQKTINYCLESDAFNTKNGIYKKNEYDIIEILIAHIIAMRASNEFVYSNNIDSLKIAIKYIEKNLELKNSEKNKFYYLAALKHLSTIHRSEKKEKEAIETHRLLLDGNECFKNLSKMQTKLQIKCNEEKINLAVLLMDTKKKNDEKEAFKILSKVLKDESKKNYDPANRNFVRLVLSSYYTYQQKFEQAEKYIYEAISFLELSEEPKEQYYVYLDRLYHIYHMMGHVGEAAAGYEKLISDIKSDFGKDSLLLLTPLGSLMQIYSSNKLLEAEKIQKQLINVLKNNPEYAYSTQSVYGKIAEVYANLNNHKEAEKYWLKAIEKNRFNRQLFLMPLVLAKLSLNKDKEAEELIKSFTPNNSYEQIQLYVANDIFFNRQKKIHKYKKNFVNLYLYFSSYSKGLISDVSKESINFYSLYILGFLNNLTNLSEKDFKIVSNYFKNETNKEIDSAIIELFEIVRSSKFNQRVKNIVDRSRNPIVEAEKRKLQDLIIEYEKLPKISKNKKEREKNINNLKLIKDKILKQKEIIFSKLNISSISNITNDILLGDIQNEINKDQAIISYFIAPDSLYILCITNENFIIKKKNVKNEQIRKLITKVIRSVKINEIGQLNKFDFENSKIIYDLILKPVEKIIFDKKELIIIPHKSLLSLPIEILVQNKIKASNSLNYSKVDWIGKKFAISYYPSVYSFYNLKKINFKNAKYSFLGFGDPDFKSSNQTVSKKIDYTKLMARGIANADEIRKMSSLPETADELAYIANIFKKNSKLYLGKDFNEKKLKSLDMSNYKFISFATHAVVANQINNIAEPGLILTPPKKSTKDNDGILTVSEIEKLNLKSDIVILSACNTASEDGTPNGEGLSGLASAFFHAGTKSMLVTHWDVETNSAVKLTTGTFDKYNKTINLSTALQKTKLEMINNDETSHPFFWAPFTLIGNISK